MKEQLNAEIIQKYLKEHSAEEINSELEKNGIMLPDNEDKELSLDDLESVNGGVITNQGINAVKAQLVFLFLIYGKDLTLDIVINYLKDFYSTNEQSSLDTLGQNLTAKEAVLIATTIWGKK